MEKQLSYVLMLSLQEMALRRIAVILWDKPDILDSIGKLQFKPSEWNKIEWRDTVECKVTDRISELQIPETFTKKLIQIVKPIGSQVLRWKVFHEFCLSDCCEKFGVPILEKLLWTSIGTVDYRKTAEALVRSDVVDIVKRYKLASLYCLEDYIPAFWKELPEEIKRTFYNEEATPRIAEPPLYFCWPYILEGEEYKLDCMPRSVFGRTWIRGILQDPSRTRFHLYAFQHSSFTGNKTAVEYFFQKLTREQRDASLVQTALDVVRNRNWNFRIALRFTNGTFSDVLCYLLSQMTPEEQIQIFKTLPFEVLSCFMEWPWQDLFFDIADVIWTFLPKWQYNYLLSEIYWSIKDSGYYLPNLLQNLFLRSPIDFGKHFVNEEYRIVYFFEEFFDIQDTETIKVIFRNVDTADRVKLIFSPFVFYLFHKYIWKDKWHMVEVCLREAKLCKEDKERLREDFMGFYSNTVWGDPKWRRFCEFLDEIDASAESKRSSEDEALTKVKKLCCEKEEK